MSIHFLAVLGTNLYEPVIYQMPEESGLRSEQEFVQIAILENMQEQFSDGGKISIFLTEEAKRRNWEDREYNDADVSASRRWISSRKNEIQSGNRKRGMKSIMQSEYPKLYARAEGIDICNAGTEEEIWSVFETIYNTIEEGDEIVFDITHGFRSIPMLVITVINYAKVLKNCTLRGIYYGAYEASVTKEVKCVPIVNLSVYNEILDWTNAAEAFMQYGIAEKMKKVYEAKKKTIPDDVKREWAPIGDKIKAMQELSMAIFTCRGTDAQKIAPKTKINIAAGKSIKNAYQQLVRQRTEKSETESREITEIKPLYPLMERIDEEYRKYFEKEKNYEIGLSVVAWSIKNNMVQQGYTALEETIKTYLCDYYGIDDQTEKTRDDIIWKIIMEICKYIEIKQSQSAFDSDRETAAAVMQKKLKVEADDETVRKIILTVPIELVDLSKKVKEKRNDISHFGFRTSPASSGNLMEELGKLYQDFVAFIGDATEDA